MVDDVYSYPIVLGNLFDLAEHCKLFWFACRSAFDGGDYVLYFLEKIVNVTRRKNIRRSQLLDVQIDVTRYRLRIVTKAVVRLQICNHPVMREHMVRIAKS